MAKEISRSMLETTPGEGKNFGGLTMKIIGSNPDEMFADFYFEGKKLNLGPKAEELLQFFFETANQSMIRNRFVFVTKADFFEEIEFEGVPLWSLRVHIGKIRRVFEENKMPHQIFSVRKQGYRLTW